MLAEPADAMGVAVRLAVTGYGPGDGVMCMVADAEVVVLVCVGGEPVTAARTAGTTVLPGFISPPYPGLVDPLAYEIMPVAARVARIPEGYLCPNPAGRVPVALGAESLRAAIAEREVAHQDGYLVGTSGHGTTGRFIVRVIENYRFRDRKSASWL